MVAAITLALLLAEPAAPAAAAQARELSQAGQKLFKQGRFLEAIEKFESAYAVRPHPSLYFNIAKCREELRQPAKALSAYREYLRLSPGATDRVAVEAAMAGLQRQLAQQGTQQLAVIATPADA